MNGALLDSQKKCGFEYAEPGEPAFRIGAIRVGDDVVSLSSHSWDANRLNDDFSHENLQARVDPLNSDANGLAGWGMS